MRHFIAYHNTEKMGRSLYDGEPLRLLTNKHVNHLLHNTVWFVTGEGEGVRQFSLGSVFNVAEVGDAAEEGFKRFAAGPGHVFEPPIPIKELPWFPEVLRATGHFGLGVQQVKDETVIAALIQLAAQDGYEVVTREYPEPRDRELTDEEKSQLRGRIERGDADIYALAREFGCTSSQVAGIKAAMNR
jgi:hypothetical protein